MIRSATTSDAAGIAKIYNHYVLRSTITFEEQAVSVTEMQQRIDEVLSGLPWPVWDENGVVHGFAYAGKWKGRWAYRYSEEATV